MKLDLWPEGADLAEIQKLAAALIKRQVVGK